MARQLRVYSAAINHPDERGVPEAERTGPFITLNVVSEDEAIRLASQLLEAVRHKRGSHR